MDKVPSFHLEQPTVDDDLRTVERIQINVNQFQDLDLEPSSIIYPTDLERKMIKNYLNIHPNPNTNFQHFENGIVSVNI